MRLIYSIPFFVTSVSILIAAGYGARRHKVPGAWHLILMCLSATVYAAFEGARFLTSDLGTDMAMTYLQYLGASTMIPFAILFVLTAFRMETWINRITVGLLTFGAAATLILVWTDPLHHLVYADTRYITGGAFPMRVYTPGILWWAIVIYNYLLMVAFTLLLVHILRTSVGIHRTQAGLLLAAAAVAWMVHAVFVTGYSPLPNVDISPLAFSLVAAAMVTSISKYNLLDVLPIARREIFTGLSDPILILESSNHLLDLNPAAEMLLEIRGGESFGQDIGHLLGRYPALLESILEGIPKEIQLDLKDRHHHFSIRFSPLTGRRGRSAGRVVVLQDITERKQAREAMYEAERLRGVLEMAGAVCHDLSQPAMASSGYAELILAGASGGDPLRAPLVTLIEEVEKLGDINKKLLKITQRRSNDSH